MGQFNDDLGMTENEDKLERVLDSIYATAEMAKEKLAKDLNNHQIKQLKMLSGELSSACEDVLKERSERN